MFRRIPLTQMVFVTLLGVGGGIYIYKPYFEPVLQTPDRQQNQDVPKKQ
nr:protein PIGBOS1 [Scatophagus argus]